MSYLEQQAVSLDLAKKLSEAEIEIDNQFIWIIDKKIVVFAAKKKTKI